MNNPEFNTGKPEESYQVVSRSLLITLAPASDIYNYLKTKGEKSDGNFTLLRILLAQKGEKGERQGEKGERLTFPGGKLNPYEDYEEAAQREITEEVGIIGIPHGDLRRLGKILGRELKNPFNKGGDCYSYSLRINGKLINRTVRLGAFFVLPWECGVDLVGDEKIREVVTVSLNDLKTLINGGKISGLSLEEHLRLFELGSQGIFEPESGERFFISQSDSEKRSQIFSQLLKHLENIEAFLKRRFTDIFAKNENLTFEDFEKIYHQEVIRFMRRGLERSLERKRVDRLSFEEGLEDEEAKKIYEGLNGAFLGSDILYFMPRILSRLIKGEDINFYLQETTEATGAFFRYFHQLKTSFFQTNKIVDEYNYFQNSAISQEKKDELIMRFNDYVKEALKKDFNITDEDINLTFAYFNDFWSRLEETLKTADKSLHEGLIQNYRLMNEASGASLGKLILLFLGTFQYQNPESKKYQLRMMFEAGRQLLLLMKGFLSLRYFHEKTLPDNQFSINSLIENLFGEPIEERIIKFEETENYYVVLVRKIGFDIEGEQACFIVDKKPEKSWLSFLRKSFKEGPGDIRDYVSLSLVYVGEDPQMFICSLTNGTFKNNLMQYLRQKYPSLDITITESPSFGLREFSKGQKETGGKRTGSQGKRILAMKYIIEIEGQQIELVVYPYLSSEDAGVDENGFWMGWKEKRNDDKNYVVRRMLAGENGMPSFYDLLFPPEIYPVLYRERLRASYHR